MRARSPLTKEFFESKLIPEPNTGCWLWTGSTGNNGGYGRLRWTDSKRRMAHVVAYELYVGPLAANLEIDHKCKVRLCCNPEHLEAVSRAENMRRNRLSICGKGHYRVELFNNRACVACYRLQHPRTTKYRSQ